MYETLKKHETLINHYNISHSMPNGKSGEISEIASVVEPGCCMHCAASIHGMMLSAFGILQRLEKEKAVTEQAQQEETTNSFANVEINDSDKKELEGNLTLAINEHIEQNDGLTFNISKTKPNGKKDKATGTK